MKQIVQPINIDLNKSQMTEAFGISPDRIEEIINELVVSPNKDNTTDSSTMIKALSEMGLTLEEYTFCLLALENVAGAVIARRAMDSLQGLIKG